jgi:hypothetical protein
LCRDVPRLSGQPVTGVPIGYVITVTVVALGTWCAVVPLRRPWALGGLSFFLGPFVNEVPFVAFAWLLIWTLLAINEGDLDQPGGRAALGVAILVTIGLGVVIRRALRTGPAVQRALAEGLGSRWRADLGGERVARLPRHLPLARMGRHGPVIKLPRLRHASPVESDHGSRGRLGRAD